jgi:hypothetical protein
MRCRQLGALFSWATTLRGSFETCRLGAETAYPVSERPEEWRVLRRDGPVVLEVASSIRVGRSQGCPPGESQCQWTLSKQHLARSKASCSITSPDGTTCQHRRLPTQTGGKSPAPAILGERCSGARSRSRLGEGVGPERGSSAESRQAGTIDPAEIERWRRQGNRVGPASSKPHAFQPLHS